MNYDLTEGNIMKKLLKFAFPIILGNMLQQLYNVADTLIVGRFLGENALAAVGSSYTLMVLTLAVLTAGMFLADSAALLLASSRTTSALETFKLSRTFLKFLVLISSKLKSSTTMNLLSFTLLVRADLRAALFSFLLSLMV